MGYPNWRTPSSVFKLLDDEFHFTLDACASHANAKIARYCTEDGKFVRVQQGPDKWKNQISLLDGLSPESWRDEVVFCNPPYTAKALRDAVFCANLRWAKTAVLLLPPHLDAKWARDIWPESTRAPFGSPVAGINAFKHWTSINMWSDKWELRLWNGRIRFGMPKHQLLDGPDESDPETVEGPSPRSGNMIAIWRQMG